jgi:hypothetical protein
MACQEHWLTQVQMIAVFVDEQVVYRFQRRDGDAALILLHVIVRRVPIKPRHCAVLERNCHLPSASYQQQKAGWCLIDPGLACCLVLLLRSKH